MKRRPCVLLAIALLLTMMCIRVSYRNPGWGGYFSVDLAAPWN